MTPAELTKAQNDASEALKLAETDLAVKKKALSDASSAMKKAQKLQMECMKKAYELSQTKPTSK